MTSTVDLSGSRMRVYNDVFQYPLSHNIEWNDICAMLRQVAEVEDESNGHLKVNRYGQAPILDPPNAKDVSSADETMALRRFLERTEKSEANFHGSVPYWLLVIDHHKARVSRAESYEAIPQPILFHEPDRYFRHAHNAKDFSRGHEKAEPNRYCKLIVKTLRHQGHVFLFGSGSGASRETGQFVPWVAIIRHRIASCIVGSPVVELHHLIKDQRFAKAREFNCGHPMS